jgi:Na+-driven multidrug efflux pump
MRRTDGSKLVLRKIRFYKEQLSKQIRIGLPAAVNSSLFSISNITIQSSINSFGEVFMSGNAAAVNIGEFISVISASFYQGSLNFTGQNIGARQYKRAKQSVFVCILCSSLITLAASRLAIFFGQEILGVYIPDSQEAIDCGMVRLNIICAYWFIGAIMDSTTGALRGIGASTVPMIISVLGVCGIRILWVYTIFQIPQYHTPESLFFSYPVSWIVTSLAQFIAFFIVLRKKEKITNA